MHASHTAAKYMEQTLTKHFLNINTTSKDRENLTPTRPKKSSKDRETRQMDLSEKKYGQ